MRLSFEKKVTALSAHALFELVAVTSKDGFIARYSGDKVSLWSSPEEQRRFRRCFDGIDWGIMGRVTHEQAFKPERRRIVFSRSVSTPVWRERNHLWVNPATTSLASMLKAAALRHRVKHNLILGGTAVHDWFLEQEKITKIQLAIEPCQFGRGVPLFSDKRSANPLKLLQALGFELISSEKLNSNGSYWHVLERAPG